VDETTLPKLVGLAAFVAVVHTISGPDHYLPFAAMARAGRWSLRKTILVTVACGMGHVCGSMALGFLGIAIGWSSGGLEWFQNARGALVGWLLIALGLVYFGWGVRRIAGNRPHRHLHVHADGTIHAHSHHHRDEHAHVHVDAAAPGRMAPWVLFTIFVFGPCEPLIPILMVPAAMQSLAAATLVTIVFAVGTVGTMTLCVMATHWGVQSLPFGRLERYSHLVAGFVIAGCGAAIQFGL